MENIMKNLFLVNCEVVKTYYMSNTKTSEINHIVVAESEEEAIGKVKDFYSKQDDEFNVSHWVNINYCSKVIY